MRCLLILPLVTACAPLVAADSTATLWFDKPATSFHQSLPLGNGRIGAMVFGGVDEERIVLNESSVWSGSREDADRPDAHKVLPEIRRLLLEGKNVEAEQLVNANFTCQGEGSGHGQRRQCAVRLLPDARQSAAEVSARQRTGAAGAPAGIARGRTTRRSSSRWMGTRKRNGASSTTAGPWLAARRRQRRCDPRALRLTSAEDVPARDPRTWKLEGSADGELLDAARRAQGRAAVRAAARDPAYTIAQPAACRFFRFTFMPNPGVTHFQVAEIQLDGVETRQRWQHAGAEEYSRTTRSGDGNGAGRLSREAACGSRGAFRQRAR